jgi:DNA-directed RNA polymerase specialized sigma24 family protein
MELADAAGLRSSYGMNERPGDDPTDEALAETFRSDPEGPRGRRAAGELLARYRGRVYAWCYRMIGRHEPALDLAQDVLLKAWASLPGFAGRSRF